MLKRRGNLGIIRNYCLEIKRQKEETNCPEDSMNCILRSLAAVIIVGVCVPCAFAYSGGDGTAGNPYQIANVADFMAINL